MKKMQIFQLTGVGQHHIVEVKQAQPKADEVLMEVKSVVTCPQWDQRLYLKGENPIDMKVSFPQPLGWPGHEAAGVILEVGANVTRVKPGDAVAAIYVRIPEGEDMGLYAPIACVKETDVVKLEGAVHFDGAASYGMLRDIVYAARLLGKVEGKVAAVTGLGSGGLMAVQVLKAFGACQVFGIDPNAARRELVVRKGYCTDAFDPIAEPEGKRLDEAGLQMGLDCSGIPSSMQMLLDHAQEHLVIFGVPHGDIRFGMRHWSSERKVQGVNINKATEEDNQIAVRLMQSGQVDTAVVATHRGTFAKYDEAVDMLRRQEAIKVYFRPSEELGYDK
jgi:threonine 3-dehydrogenase